MTMGQWHVASRTVGTETWTLDLEPHSDWWVQDLLTLYRQYGNGTKEYRLIPADHVKRYLCVAGIPTPAQYNTLSVFAPGMRGWQPGVPGDSAGCIERGWLARGCDGYQLTQSGEHMWRREYWRRRAVHQVQCGCETGQ